MGLKVVKHTADELVIRSASHLIWSLSGGLILLGLLVTTLVAGAFSFECDRGKGECVLEKNWLLRGTERTTYPLEDLQGAHLARYEDLEDQTTSYRVVFLIGEDRIGLTESSSGFGRASKEEAVQEVLGFLADPEQERVRVKESSYLAGLLGGLIFFMMGFLATFFGFYGKFRFSIPEGRFSVRTFGPLVQQKQEDFALSDVRWVENDYIYPEFVSSLAKIELQGGRSVQMSSFFSGMGGAVSVINALNRFFLDRPRSDKEIGAGRENPELGLTSEDGWEPKQESADPGLNSPDLW